MPSLIRFWAFAFNRDGRHNFALVELQAVCIGHARIRSALRDDHELELGGSVPVDEIGPSAAAYEPRALQVSVIL